MSKLVVFDGGMRGIDTQYASMTDVGELKVQEVQTNTIRTTQIPGGTDMIGWYNIQVISAGSKLLANGTYAFNQLVNITLDPGVYYLRGGVSIDPNGNIFDSKAIIQELGGVVLAENEVRNWGFAVFPNICTHILEVPYGTTMNVEFGSAINYNFFLMEQR
jgi:hypothetical protein